MKNKITVFSLSSSEEIGPRGQSILGTMLGDRKSPSLRRW